MKNKLTNNEDKMKLKIGKKYNGEEKYNVEYFVWGKIDGD